MERINKLYAIIKQKKIKISKNFVYIYENKKLLYE